MKKLASTLIALFLVAIFSQTAEAKWRSDQGSAEQSLLLSRVEKLVEATKNPVVIFDLDATLFDGRPRSVAILHEYANVKKAPALKKLKKEDVTSWVIQDYLINDAKIEAAWVKANIKDIKNFWKERFFINDYLKYDTPLPGAVAYVNNLYKKGAYIVYITGRDSVNMKEGTIASLKKAGFPINKPRSQLILKPTSNLKIDKDVNQYKSGKKIATSDVNYKVKAMEEAKKLGTIVASFDNEPGNINKFYENLHRSGKGMAIWIDTETSPKAEKVKKGIYTIVGFK